MIETAASDLGHILDSLGWAIFHSLWQCSLAAVVVILFRALTRDNQATLRYSFQLLTLLSCFLAFAVTFAAYYINYAGGTAATNHSAALSSISAIFGDQILPNSALTKNTFSANLSLFTPILGIIWCLGFTALALRYLGAFAVTQHLRRNGLVTVPAQWSRRFETLVLNSGIRRQVTFYISNRISSPLTLGFFKPIVLVPASFFSGLPPQQMEAILLHEIAHIRRHDYLINLFQTAIRTIFFFHPAVYFISRLIDNDREHACDDFAVAHTQNPKALARALVALRLGAPQNRFALAADNGNTPLIARLNRLGYGATSRRRPEQAAASVGTLILAAALVPVANSYADARPTPAITSAANPSHPSGKLGNYRFEKIRKNNRDITVKIANDGTRWINVNGVWHDVDKSPQRINELPVIPVAPQPPIQKMDRKTQSQFKIDKAYYKARIELETISKSEILQPIANPVTPIYDARKVDAHMQSLRQKREAAFIQTHQSREDLGRALSGVGGAKIIPIATLPPGPTSTSWKPQPPKQLDLPAKDERKMDDLADADDWLGEFVTQMVEIETNHALAKISHEDAEASRKKAQRQLEARIQNSQMGLSSRQHTRRDNRTEKFNRDVLKQLRMDGLISQNTHAVTITYPNLDMAVNGTTIPDHLQDNYCHIMASYGVKKRRDTQIQITLAPFTDGTKLKPSQDFKQAAPKAAKTLTLEASSWAVPAHVKPVISFDFDYKIDKIKTLTEATNRSNSLRHIPDRETSIGHQKALLSPK